MIENREIIPAKPGQTSFYNGRECPVLGWIRLEQSGRLVPLVDAFGVLSRQNEKGPAECCEHSTGQTPEKDTKSIH